MLPTWSLTKQQLSSSSKVLLEKLTVPQTIK